MENLVDFETAILAKKKGFDEPVFYKYCDKGIVYVSYTAEQYWGLDPLEEFFSDGDGDGFIKNSQLPWNNIYQSDNEDKIVNIIVSAPTQSELQEWLREKHNIHIQVWYDNTQKDGYPYLYKIYDQNNEPVDSDGWYYDNWEGALEEGLQEALKLIS